MIMMMNDRLSFAQIALLVAYAGGMVGGQLLFKLAALRAATEGPLGERLSAMMLNGYFAAAVLLYAALTVLWVWILNFTPLSRAYVFVALAFAVTPLLGGVLFAEPISLRLVIGIALIFCGLLFVAG
jgi:drug/metabolite transporter (DMT)-like permease